MWNRVGGRTSIHPRIRMQMRKFYESFIHNWKEGNILSMDKRIGCGNKNVSEYYLLFFFHSYAQKWVSRYLLIFYDTQFHSHI